jgi:hypothetical protein
MKNLIGALVITLMGSVSMAGVDSSGGTGPLDVYAQCEGDVLGTQTGIIVRSTAVVTFVQGLYYLVNNPDESQSLKCVRGDGKSNLLWHCTQITRGEAVTEIKIIAQSNGAPIAQVLVGRYGNQLQVAGTLNCFEPKN